MSRRLRRTLLIGTCAALVGSTGLIAGASAVDQAGDRPDQVDAPVPELDWSPCGQDQCAKAEVPLDYDDPGGGTMTLALRKIPARDPDRRIGSLFVNLGGPPSIATDNPMFALATGGFGREVRARFDIIGIDSRASGGSSPTTCRRASGEDPVEKPAEAFPRSAQEARAWIAYERHVRKSCAETARPVLDHLTTTDTARDMDLIRQAVGDDKLTYYGVSYGTIVGQTYAALFPDRVRALVIDGVLDPVLQTDPDDRGEPLALRTRLGETREQAFEAAMDRCDRAGFPRCPLAGDAALRWERVRDSLAQKPLRLGDLVIDDRQFVGTYTMMAFQSDHLGGYPVPTIELLAAATKILEVLRSGPGGSGVDGRDVRLSDGRVVDLTAPRSVLEDRLGELLEQIRSGASLATDGRASGGDGDGDGDEDEDVSGGGLPSYGGMCTDSSNPRADPGLWLDAAGQAERSAPRFGAHAVWIFSMCADWPGSDADAYRGPFDTETSTPPLIVGNTYDFSTPLRDAKAAQQLLAGSRLVTLESWGHTAIGKSTCVREHTDAYLLEQTLPARDVTCRANSRLFGIG